MNLREFLDGYRRQDDMLMNRFQRYLYSPSSGRTLERKFRARAAYQAQ